MNEDQLTKGSQTGRKLRQNLIKFNKAERIAQAVNLLSLSFTTSAYLNTFTPRSFICVCIHWKGGKTRRGMAMLIAFFIWMLTKDGRHLCKLTQWLSCILSHKYHLSSQILLTLSFPPLSSVSCLPFLLFNQHRQKWYVRDLCQRHLTIYPGIFCFSYSPL